MKFIHLYLFNYVRGITISYSWIIFAAPYGHVHKAGSLAEVNFLEISKNARNPHVLT